MIGYPSFPAFDRHMHEFTMLDERSNVVIAGELANFLVVVPFIARRLC